MTKSGFVPAVALVLTVCGVHRRGAALFRHRGGQGPVANPISFGVDGKQYVAIAAGYSLYVFGL